MKKQFIVILFLFIASIFLSAYNFPEELPKPFELNNFYFKKLKFGQTSVNEFAYIAPKYTNPHTEGVYTIYSESQLNNTYKFLRIGFKENYLDWIELDFAVPQSLAKFESIYGKPLSINKEYSKKFNYHDYGFFNAVSDKNNATVWSITLYGESDFNRSLDEIIKMLPDYRSFNFISYLIPGKLLESEFRQRFNDLKLATSNVSKSEDTYKIEKKYLINNPNYSEAKFVFSNGMLSFVSLTPKNLPVAEIKKIYGEGKLVKSSKKDTAFLEYPNFVVTFNSATYRATNIGIVGAD